MKKKIKTVMAALIMSSGAWSAYATVLYPAIQINWPNGEQAANCSFTSPTLLPLSQQRSLIAEDSLPNGSVIYSWDYSDFAPDFHATCHGTTEYITPSPQSYPELRIIDRLDFNGLNSNLLAGEWLWGTNNPGVALKLYIKLTERGDLDTGYLLDKYSRSTYVSNALNSIPLGQEINLTPSFGSIGVIDGTMNSALFGGRSIINLSMHYFKYSVRGELIKIGNIEPGNPLSISPSATMTHAFFMNNHADDSQNENIGFTMMYPNTIFGSDGITFVKPSCRLKGATDYFVEMDEWAKTTSLPAYGDIKPIDINIECNGVVGNVKFSFQDTGYTSLNNRNISLYDSIGGQPIEGLEI